MYEFFIQKFKQRCVYWGGGVGGDTPNISEIARKLVKSGLYCKRFSISLVIISSVT